MKQLVCAALLLVACGGSEAAKPVAPRADSAPPQSAAPGSAESKPAAQASGAALALALSVEHTHDGLGLHVINRGPGALSLAADVALEKKVGQGYTAVAAQALKLRFDCKSQGCVSLAPGAELVAPAWLGRPDGERCDGLVAPLEPGSYRFVVRSCAGTEQAEHAFVAAPPVRAPADESGAKPR